MEEKFSFFSFKKEDYALIKEEVWKDNRQSLRVFAVIGIAIFAMMTLVSHFSPSIYRNKGLYLTYALVSAVIYILMSLKAVPVRVKNLLVYVFFMALLSFGIVMGTLLTPNDLTVAYIVMLIAVPLLFTARTWIMNSIILCSLVVYIVMASRTQPPAIFAYNLVNIIPYCLLSLVITAIIMRHKMQKILYRLRIETLEIDNRHIHDKIDTYDVFITDMVRYASSEGEPNKVINQLIQYICENLKADRAYIFEENDTGSFDNTYEWCREGVSAEIDNLQNVPYEGVIEVGYNGYRKSNNIIIRNLEDYRSISQPMYDILKPQGINSLVTGPIIVEGKMVGFYGVDNPPLDKLQDISDLISMMEFIISFMLRLRDNTQEMTYNALHDGMTDTLNRKALEALYTRHFDSSHSLAIAMCDVNNLKITNDQYGHDAGDRLILNVCAVMKSVFGEGTIYRLGGDEFIAVDTAISREGFERKVAMARELMGSNGSLGAVYQDSMAGGLVFEDILKQADEDMYRQKSEFYKASGIDRRRRG